MLVLTVRDQESIVIGRGDSEEAGEHYRRALDLSRKAHERRQALARP